MQKISGYFKRSAPEPGKRPVVIFMAPFSRWPIGLRAAFGAAVIVSGSAVAYLGATLYPDYSIPTGPKAEKRIAQVFGMPVDSDPQLVGDIVIERFHGVEPETGKPFVADMCKGRVSQVIEVQKDDGSVAYSVVLDRRGLQLDQLRTLIEDAAPPETNITYLGVQLQGGNTDVFAVNYGGILARRRAEFRGPHGEDTYAYLKKFKTPNIGPSPVLLTNKDNNFVLSSTVNFPYFTSLFKLKNAVFLSHLVFLDATSESSGQAGSQ